MVEKLTVSSFQLENKYISDVFVKHDYMSDYQVVPDVGEQISVAQFGLVDVLE